MQSVIYLAGFLVVFVVANSQQCEDAEFECANGNCIREMWFCDGDNDCGDWSDEPENCVPPCPDGYYICPSGKCIPPVLVCDGDNNCGDWSDENEDCPPCPPRFWECPNGECIFDGFSCDGWNDCGDWGDESDEKCPCADNEVKCPTLSPPGEGPGGGCIPSEFVCDLDGIWDCPDGFDEVNCTIRSTSTRKVHKVNRVVGKKVSKPREAVNILRDSRKKFIKVISETMKRQN